MADPYRVERCGVCGVPWTDDSGDAIHPADLQCARYRPAAVARTDPDAGNDSRKLRVVPDVACPPTYKRTSGVACGTPSFRGHRPGAAKATETRPSEGGPADD